MPYFPRLIQLLIVAKTVRLEQVKQRTAKAGPRR
jgi:hypothetical protein